MKVKTAGKMGLLSENQKAFLYKMLAENDCYFCGTKQRGLKTILYKENEHAKAVEISICEECYGR